MPDKELVMPWQGETYIEPCRLRRRLINKGRTRRGIRNRRQEHPPPPGRQGAFCLFFMFLKLVHKRKLHSRAWEPPCTVSAVIIPGGRLRLSSNPWCSTHSQVSMWTFGLSVINLYVLHQTWRHNERDLNDRSLEKQARGWVRRI